MKRSVSRSALLGLAICLISLLSLLTPAQAQQAGQFVFILDASGSMWAQVDNKPKIEIAKEVMTDLINGLAPEIRAGLVAYGHRSKGDCNDVEELFPLGQVDKQAMIAKIKSINPKGKTPISLSIKQTAEKLKTEEDETTIVLVSDGKETCDPDPCGVVKALKDSGVKFVLHVVGFDVTDEERQQLECMAQAGGGQYFTAQNSADLRNAAQKTIENAPEPPAKGRLKLTAMVNGKPAVVKAEVGAKGTWGKNQFSTSADPDKPAIVELLPGDYTVTVKAPEGAKADVVFDAKVEPKKTFEKTVEFTISQIRVKTVKNGKPAKALIEIYRAGSNERIQSGRTTSDQAAVFTLQAGEYEINAIDEATQGQPAIRVKGIKLDAGQVLDQTIEISDSGTLKLTIMKGGKVVPAVIEIYQNGNKVTWGRARDDGLAVFELKPGNYEVTALDETVQGHPKTPPLAVSVSSGQALDKTIELAGSGTLKLKVVKSGKVAPAIIEIYQDGKKVTWDRARNDGLVTLEFAAGNYEVLAIDESIQGHPKTNPTPFTITPGQAVEKVIELPGT